MGVIRERVPVGFNHQKESQPEKYMPDSTFLILETAGVCEREYQSARKQLGTLGGGNHFIELQVDEDGWIWIMIHSGSRNLGKKVADFYNKTAMILNEKYFAGEQFTKGELNFLPLDSEMGQAYLTEMQYCVDFALANRALMMQKVKEAIQYRETLTETTFSTPINIAHNYAKMENHFGKNVLVHRKGATLAREGTTGIIPGSQGTKSYIVEGKGNPQSFNSCSHGAGRKMGRKQATRELSLHDEIKRLDDQGIIHGIRNTKDLDEASGAYKDIDAVMENQKDLVSIERKLTPLAVIKG